MDQEERWNESLWQNQLGQLGSIVTLDDHCFVLFKRRVDGFGLCDINETALLIWKEHKQHGRFPLDVYDNKAAFRMKVKHNQSIDVLVLKSLSVKKNHRTIRKPESPS